MDRRWKARERQVARALGTERIPSDGRPTPDIVADGIAVEHKSRESLPKWLTDACEQARRNARGLAPIVVLSAGQGPGRPLRRLVVIEFDEFLELRKQWRTTD